MKSTQLKPEDFHGVIAVPPLPRKPDATRSIDTEQSGRIVRHIAGGGISRFMYGGNAFLYHISLADYEALLDWLASLPDEYLVIPSAGPSFGRAMDQAPLLKKHGFPSVMMLPCADPRDAAGLETGLRALASATSAKLVLYLKEESNLGTDKEAGLDVVARLVNDGLCVAIKYAVVRADPTKDDYLKALLRRVDRSRVISGIGERPAVVHLRDWDLPAFTTGSGCVAPRLSQQLYHACLKRDFAKAEEIRATFLPLEDLRDSWNPAKVLHFATELAGIAKTGPILPYLSGLSSSQLSMLEPVARNLWEANQRH